MGAPKGSHNSLKTEFKKGYISWNKGISRTEQTKNKIRLTKKNNPYKHTKEAKIKIIKSLLNRSLDIRKRCLIRRKKSSLEEKFESIIKKYNLPYKFVGNGKFFIEKKNPDFINCNGEKIAVEVFYRGHKDYFRGGCERWKKDRENIFKKYGWKVLFFNETQVNEYFVLKNINKKRG